MTPSLFAAAALLIDYVLTVSVSVSAGVRAITSAWPALFPYSVALALFAIFILTWVNLRGVRESGSIFALPTYAFVGGVLLIILIGLVRLFGLFGAAAPVAPVHNGIPAVIGETSNFLFLWLLVRAFAAGCTALTGIEAISDGVIAFKPPEAKNAAKTMVVMGVLAMTLFFGITYLATHIDLIPHEQESVLSQLARSVTVGLPGGGALYLWVQLFTMLILVLAANTGFQDFPRVASFLARDGFMPRWMQNRGDRLVFNSGIMMLAGVSALLVIVFRADEIAMLPLYALGVMLGFTLSQTSMVRLFNRIARLEPGESADTENTTIHYDRLARWKRFLPGVGAIITGIVLVALVVTKFLEGAWIVVIAIPLLVMLFRAIRHHYDVTAEQLSLRDIDLTALPTFADVVIIPMADVHRGTVQALHYAKQVSRNVRAIHIATSPESTTRFMRRWKRMASITGGIEPIMVDYEYRDILTPLVEYIENVSNKEYPGQIVTVVVPEFVPDSLPAQVLHNQTANFLRLRLRQLKEVVVIDVPWHIGEGAT